MLVCVKIKHSQIFYIDFVITVIVWQASNLHGSRDTLSNHLCVRPELTNLCNKCVTHVHVVSMSN